MSYPTHTHDGKCGNADPFNLVFRINIKINMVDSELTKEHWTGPIFAWKHHLHTGTGKVNQHRQRVLGNLFARYHVRLWEWNGEVIANAHHEYLSIGLGTHVLVDYEPAERLVDNLFQQAGWTVSYDAEPINNFQHYPFNDGMATVARR